MFSHQERSGGQQSSKAHIQLDSDPPALSRESLLHGNQQEECPAPRLRLSPPSGRTEMPTISSTYLNTRSEESVPKRSLPASCQPCFADASMWAAKSCRGGAAVPGPAAMGILLWLQDVKGVLCCHYWIHLTWGILLACSAGELTLVARWWH